MGNNASQRPPEQGIFQSLPAARPQRRSAKRAAVAPKAETHAVEQAPDTPVQPPTNTDIIASALATIGELAQSGLSLTERLLAEATRRIPKP